MGECGEFSWRSSFLAGYATCLEEIKRSYQATGHFDIAYQDRLDALSKYHNQMLNPMIYIENKE